MADFRCICGEIYNSMSVLLLTKLPGGKYICSRCNEAFRFLPPELAPRPAE